MKLIFILLAFASISACSVTEDVEPKDEQVQAIKIDYKDGLPVITKLCEGYGWMNYRVTVFHNRDIVTPFCAHEGDSIYRHTILSWDPGDTIWVDRWNGIEDGPNGLPNQTIILEKQIN